MDGLDLRSSNKPSLSKILSRIFFSVYPFIIIYYLHYECFPFKKIFCRNVLLNKNILLGILVVKISVKKNTLKKFHGVFIPLQIVSVIKTYNYSNF